MSASVTLVDLHHEQREDAPATSPGAPQSAAYGPKLGSTPSVATLPDPSTGNEREYLIIPAAGSGGACDLHEVQSLSGPSRYGSFLVGSRVVSDGNLRLATRVDPLFFVLAAADAAQQRQQQRTQEKKEVGGGGESRWQPLDQILADVPSFVSDALRNATPVRSEIGESALDGQMRHLFERTDQFGDDLILYKYDQARATEWLKAKHRRAVEGAKASLLATKLMREHEKEVTSKAGGGGGAFSSSFNLEGEAQPAMISQSPLTSQVSSGGDGATASPIPLLGDTSSLSKEEETQLGVAGLHLVCEYLSEGWRTKLIAALGMKESDLLGSRGERHKNANDAGAAALNSNTSVAGAGYTSVPSGSDRLLQISRGVDGSGGAAGGSAIVDEEERKKEEKKRKAMNAKSVGLKRLAKVNTKGMKSLSCFFGAGGAKKKAKKA